MSEIQLKLDQTGTAAKKIYLSTQGHSIHIHLSNVCPKIFFKLVGHPGHVGQIARHSK